jgi:hypothetical protein
MPLMPLSDPKCAHNGCAGPGRLDVQHVTVKDLWRRRWGASTESRLIPNLALSAIANP